MKDVDLRKLLIVLLIAFAAGIPVGLVAPSMKGCAVLPVAEPAKPKADQVVYVYEKDDHAPPVEVMLMLDKLNRAGIRATDIDDDVTDGDGQVPDQYKAAIDAARLAGLPAFVVLGKGEFLNFANLSDLEKLLENSK